MARVKPSLVEYSGTVGDKVHYTRFGRSYSRNRPQHFNDCQSEAQLRQRALFKAMQHTSALFGSMLQRGLTKYAHSKGHTEANEFARINKGHFVYEDGKVHINYPALQLAVGPLPVVKFTRCHADGLHVEIDFDANLSEEKARPDDVVHIYAVEPQVEICQLMASVLREDGQIAFNLPDLSDETNGMQTFYLYAIVEDFNTAVTPTLSPDEKQRDKKHRNINRRVFYSVFIGTITLGMSV